VHRRERPCERLPTDTPDFDRQGFASGCFAAGTSTSDRTIETIRAGEVVYSRDEHDPSGAVEAKVVEEVFERWPVCTFCT